MMTAAAKKLTIQSAIAVFVFAALLFLLILPKVGVVRKLAADVRITLEENQRLQAVVLTAKHSGDRLDEIQGTLARYKAKALYQEDLTRVLDDIGAAAQKAGLNVVSLRALDEPRRIPGESFAEGSLEIQHVMISLKADGQYADLVEYFKALERLPYFSAVQTLFLKSLSFGPAAEGKDPRLSAEVMLAVLMRVPPVKQKV